MVFLRSTLNHPCLLSHGPQWKAPLGPKRAITGVFTAAAICMGAESTPKNRSDASEIAASCFMFVLPHRSMTPLRAFQGDVGFRDSAANDNIFLVFFNFS